MSYESTRTIKKREAIEWIFKIFAEKMAKLQSLSNKELEDLLYSLTRDTNYFDNFIIEND